MLRMAARVADNIMLGDPTPGVLAAAMENLDRELLAAGRRRQDLRISGLVAWHVKADARQSLAEARQQLALRGMLDAWYLRPFLDEDEIRLVESHREAFFSAYKKNTPVIEGVPDPVIDKLVSNLTCSGSEADIDRHIARLKGFRDLGLTDVALKLHNDQAEAIRMIGERVVPDLH
jgi:alkanesulfonate monooxygenase SsuD/methylene tetrahydromethanopterin reductase-like flavin-dependent oxidoreductase (luciferase family)